MKRIVKRVEMQHDDGLDTWIKRFSSRQLAEFVATSIRERDIEARVHDRMWTHRLGISRKERYEILIHKSDMVRAVSIANLAIAQWKENHP